MSVRVMAWVWEHSQSRKNERLVLLAIADCASDDGANAYPSMAELMRKTGLSERGVQTAMTKLVALGELFVGRNLGPRGCNRYRVVMCDPAESAPPQILHPAESAPPQILHPAESAVPRKVEGRQRKARNPADSAPPADPAPPQDLRSTPAESAPGTVLEPSENSSSKSSSRGTRIPADFTVTPAMVAWARETVPDVDGRRETEKFINYWRAKSGRDATKRDWPATWRNWMLNAADRLPNGRTGHRPYRNPTDPNAYYGDL